MKAQKQNYSRNIEILKENLKRGMGQSMAIEIIKQQKKQFIKAGLYGQDEKDYINKMLDVVGVKIIKATELAKKIGIEVINN